MYMAFTFMKCGNWMRPARVCRVSTTALGIPFCFS